MHNNKFLYYAQNILRQFVPKFLYEKSLQSKLNPNTTLDLSAIWNRVNYYNKLQRFADLNNDAPTLKDFRIFKRPKTYRFDTYEYTRYFGSELRANFLFGDITYISKYPTIQKSRPINNLNANAILLNLNKARHFLFVKDKKQFIAKKNMLIGRGNIHLEHRKRFMRMYFNHPFCDLGQINKDAENGMWVKPKISKAEQLNYKFILSLEGNDVATNLKWVMSSNSIAVMPKPKYETWFMEGRLMADYHYILIKDDYSDLEEKLNYYIENKQEAQAIVQNSNKYVQQFLNKEQEDIISLLVLSKYFYYTGQLDNGELNFKDICR